MARSTIYDEAREIITKGKIKFKGEGNDREFWEVTNHTIEVRTDRSGQKFLCDCKHCSIYYGFEPFCCFKAALISYFVLKKVVRRKVEE